MSENKRKLTRLERLEDVEEETRRERWNEFTSQFSLEDMVAIIRGTAPPELQERSDKITELEPPEEVKLIIDGIHEEVQRDGLEVVIERFISEYGAS